MVCQQGMQEMIKQATKQDHEDEITLLQRLCRKTLQDTKGFLSMVNFHLAVNRSRGQPYLKILVSMILNVTKSDKKGLIAHEGNPFFLTQIQSYMNALLDFSVRHGL